MNGSHPLAAVGARPAGRYARPFAHNTTRGQLRILAEVAAGKTTVEVAQSIGRSPQTVKNTLASVRRRLGALDSTHAVALMDDYRPGWRPRLPFPARPVDNPAARVVGFPGESDAKAGRV